MTMLLTLSPVVVSCLLAAAHFYRAGFGPLAAGCLLLPVLMISRHRFVPPLVSFLLLLAGVEWLRTLYLLAGRYREAGLPTERLTAILSGVALFTVLSPLVFRTGVLRCRYRRDRANKRFAPTEACHCPERDG